MKGMTDMIQRSDRKQGKGIQRILLFFLCAVLIFASVPLNAFAQETNQKTVRVGWYESAFHRTDAFGRKSGYGYEYQQRIAIYTGWKYEYVEGSWSELLEKLIAGELDLLSDVSYTEARAEKILYSTEAMGSEGYHVFIAPDNTEIHPDDFSSLNGKKVGVNKNSIQEQMFMEWAKSHEVDPVIVESTEKTPVLLEMLEKGEFDALVTLDTYGNTADVVPVWKVGFAESFFGINKNRPDLKKDLDSAMSRLFEENRDFNQELTNQLNKAGTVSNFLTTEELNWYNGKGVIRVGYRDDYLPFCDFDEETQELTGALKDYLEYAAGCQKNATLKFETKAFATTDEAFQALEREEIDCVFPVSLSAYDGEKIGVICTVPFVSTEMYATVRRADHQGVDRDQEMTVAVVKGNPSYESFLMDYFPKWKVKYYDDGNEAYQAVVSGEAYCGLVSNYRISRITDILSKYKLTVLTTDETMGMSFAVEREDDHLYSILNKVTHVMPETMINSSLTKYGFQDENVTLADFLRNNLAYIIGGIALIAVTILLLVIRNIKTHAKMEEGQQIILEAERDPLTDLYNRNFFFVYANRINRENPDLPMDAAYMNIDRFHSINALRGREFGNKVLTELSGEIKDFLSETEGGIGSRFEADRFGIFCRQREDWQQVLEHFQARLDDQFRNTGIHLRMGVKPWQAGMDPVPQFDRARTACNKVRGGYKSRVVIYDAAMGLREERDQQLMNDFGSALEAGELEVYYQPKYNIQGEKPVLSSAEALVRWNHPDLGLISPEIFIPLFEKSGQISTLDHYVWSKATTQMAAWRDELGIVLPVSVNLSRVDVFDPTLISKLEELIHKHGLKEQDLKLEVTESAYTENADELIKVIGELRARGYEIEMDDFGSGYSSLNMLSYMPIDVLKMDIAFIRNIERNEKDFRLVELIIDIARYLKVPVVAEGVETENQLRLLKEAGCDLVQGYYFSRALPPEDFAQKILKKTMAE